MIRYIATLIVGVILGGVLVYFLLVGAPRANKLPGEPVKPPDAGGDPPGTALVVLNEPFFDTVLATIFRDMNAPSFPLQLAQNMETGVGDGMEMRFERTSFQAACPSAVTLLPEGSNVKTSVKITGGKIMAPLAFSGSYSSILGCVRFTGWAQANLQLRFDQSQQNAYGQLNVEGVNLDGTPPVIGSVVTGLVQTAINQRVNPIQILQGHQLRLSVPIRASDGTLNAQVKDVRAEVKDGQLSLHITYEFKGQKGQQPPPS